MAAGLVGFAKRNVTSIVLPVLHVLLLICNVMDLDQGLNGWIEEYYREKRLLK